MDDIMEADIMRAKLGTDLEEASHSGSIARPQRRLHIDPTSGSVAGTTLLSGHYYIVNVFSGAYAGLLNDNDRSEVVNVIFGLNDGESRLGGSKWLITHLHRDQYKIWNATFSLFASYDNRPQLDDQVHGKAVPIQWTIRLAQSPNIYNVAPTENPNIFWTSVSDLHGTPLELDQPYTARKCQWVFRKASTVMDDPFAANRIADQIGSNAAPQPTNRQRTFSNVNALLKNLPTVPHARHEGDGRARCLEGTRVGLLRAVRDWIADPGSPPIFWLRGQAGAGKTTIALTLAHECDTLKELGASFLFSRDEADRSELRHVFTAIAKQLSAFRSAYAPFLAEAIENEPSVVDFLPDLQLDKLIVGPLNECTQKLAEKSANFLSPTVIIIDALDECKDNNPVSTFLSALSKHIRRLPMLKFFITSRPELHIQAAFKKVLQYETTSIALHDLDTFGVDEDIESFVRTSLSNGAKDYPDLVQEGWPPPSLVHQLVERSGQLFIFPATVIRAVFDPVWDDPKGRLEEVLHTSADGMLDPIDNLYLAIFKANYPAQIRPEVTKSLRDVMAAILLIANPLPASSLDLLLGLGGGKVRTVLRRLHSVFVVPDTEDTPVRIIHPSFFDFLSSRCTDARFRIDTRVHHIRLASLCLERIQTGFKPDGRQIMKPLQFEHFTRGITFQTLQYACRYWPLHLSRSNGADEVSKYLLNMLVQHSPRWFEVLSSVGTVREGEDQLRDVESFLSANITSSDRHNFPEKQATNLFRLGVASLARFEAIGEESDINRACFYLKGQQIVEALLEGHGPRHLLTQDGHSNRATLLNRLGHALILRFESLWHDDDLDASIDAQRTAVELTPDGRADKPTLLHSLGNALQSRYERSLKGSLDLDDSITTQRKAVDLTPDGHPEKSSILSSLGDALKLRYLRGGNAADLKAALETLPLSVQSVLGAPGVKLNVARNWGALSELNNDEQQAILVYAWGMSLIPETAWMALGSWRRRQVLDNIGHLVSKAAAAVARYGNPELALEWLEQGRFIIWGPTTQLRSSVDILRERDPRRAERLIEISRALDANSKDMISSAEGKARQLRVLYLEWERLLSEVRELAGLEDFLRPKRVEQLLSAAHLCPIVVLNAHDTGCDALVLLAQADEVIHIPLPHFTPKLVRSSFNSLTSVSSYIEGRSTYRVSQRKHIHVAQLGRLLSQLWSCVVKPILDGLAFPLPTSDGDNLPRICWCPVGPLAPLPIHAAGLYHTKDRGTKVFEFVVSSYTPTVTALLQSHANSQTAPKILAVGVAEYLDELVLALPKTREEIAHIGNRATANSIDIVVAKDADGTVKRVLEQMNECSWIHLACHGVHNLASSTKSAFLLADGNLELEAIAKLNIPHAEFAFLSACNLLARHPTHADEALNLGAGMLAAGYKGVIGTMWPVLDEDCPMMADAVYSELLKDGKADASRAAYALHKAAHERRLSGASLLSWMPFIHIGR